MEQSINIISVFVRPFGEAPEVIGNDLSVGGA